MHNIIHALSEYRDKHAGETIIVCGCGESLNTLTDPERFVTIGVNDVGRLFDPAYLVVLNPEHQFKGDRFQYVRSSHAQVVFSQLKLDVRHTELVQFKLGKRNGTDITVEDTLPYTRNSPYVAVCLAAYMGASRIGLIGVDLTDNHFFSNTGKHPLSGKLKQIDCEYAELFKVFKKKGIELVNLSSKSRLKSLPLMDIESFSTGTSSEYDSLRFLRSQIKKNKFEREINMKIFIERRQNGIVGDFLDAFASTAMSLGYEVSRSGARNNKNMISVVWNGRNFNSTGPVLYCEHGWLPRWDYQMSSRGINADSHVATFVWDGKVIDEQARKKLEIHLDSIRKSGGPEQYKPEKYSYMKTSAEVVQGLPEAFLLVPLQMEKDTNILRHVPSRYRRMQVLIDDISRSDPPIPVVFKQHPADLRNASRQLRLRLRRKEDLLWPQNRGNIHQLLKSSACKGIISLNSNVVHDGLVWGVPSIVLGANIWPREGVCPFGTQLPEKARTGWDDFLNTQASTEKIACREAYAYYLMKNQWSMADIKDKNKVSSLLRKISTEKYINTRSRVLKMKGRSKPVINVVARNLGWLFEDLKKHFVSADCPSVTVRASERPLENADAWIFLRTREAVYSPGPSRTVVHIHDMFNADEYKPGGTRHCVNQCAAIVLTHPGQRDLLSHNGIGIESKRVIEKPIGASSSFYLRTRMTEPFTVAWAGRPTIYQKKDIKRVDWFVQAMKQLDIPVRVVFMGEKLDRAFYSVKKAGIDCVYLQRKNHVTMKHPQSYAEFDCIVVTAEENSRQGCLFESLATGVPVISTPTAWASQYINNGENGYLVYTVDEIVEAAKRVYVNKQAWFNRRESIKNSVADCVLEDWVKENISLARSLISDVNIFKDETSSCLLQGG
ncbi:MAG TPA: glycosyltransferase [Gammaproteobacteria bacterium]|nr:glycosyltransferase [Gammaproteobacteria bacterium]